MSLLRRPVRMPTAEEDRALLEAAQGGSLAARNALVERHIPYIITVAKKFKRKLPPRCCELDDLVHAAAIGVMHAITKYDAHKARGRFMGYAAHWMRDMMQRELEFSQMYRVPSSVIFQYEHQLLKNQATIEAVERFQAHRLVGDFQECIQPRCEVDSWTAVQLRHAERGELERIELDME